MPRKPTLLKRSVATHPPGTPVVPKKKATPEKSGKRATNGKENAARNLLLEEQMNFEDETATLAVSAIENYFMQGKSAAEKMNTARVRRGRKTVATAGDDGEEEEVDEMIADFTNCDLGGLRDYIENQDESKFAEQLEYLSDNEFKNWNLYLASDFNILLHGVGSKRDVITEYIEKELKDLTYMRVDARKEGVNVKTLFGAINDYLGLNCNIKRGQSTIDWAKDICRKMQRLDCQLILIIDNIESPDWRSDQEALCGLLENRKIVKLIATVDHIYSTFIWNSRQLSSLSFIHVTINTFQVAIHELMTGESRLLGLDARSNQSSHTMSSLDAFWKSLAVNSQKLFRLFFQIYFESKKPVKFWDLFNAAKDDFIASTDSALRTQLVEFKDHRVLKWTRGDDGNDQLSGMVELKLVTEFLDSKGMPLVEEKDE